MLDEAVPKACNKRNAIKTERLQMFGAIVHYDCQN